MKLCRGRKWLPMGYRSLRLWGTEVEFTVDKFPGKLAAVVRPVHLSCPESAVSRDPRYATNLKKEVNCKRECDNQ